jgi:YVTN family beta-propeller protein
MADKITFIPFNRIGSAISCFLLCLIFTVGNHTAFSQEDYHQSVIKEGIKIDFTLQHVDIKKEPGTYREGDDVLFRFAISDTITNSPLSGSFPAAWMDKAEKHKNKTSCGDKVTSYIEGKFLSRAELDLNVYYVLTLNSDNTVSVVDPLFGYGGSKLLSIIQLQSTGYDWAVKDDQTMLYISMPEVSQVAVVSTSDWKIVANIPIGGKPKDLVLQSDGHYLWVTYDLQGKFEMNSGVAVINLETNKLVKNIETGNGKHNIVMSDDNHFVYVSNAASGTVSVIDSKTLKKIKDVNIEGAPLSMAYSSLANALYVVNTTAGSIAVIDGYAHKVIKTIPAEKGIDKIAFSPKNRFAFVNNPIANTVDIIDAALNKIVQTGDVEEQPDQITFTDEQAYVRHRGSEIVWMIPLDVIGKEGEPVPLIDFPGGNFPPAAGAPECGALGIIQAPGANAVLVSNYKDKAIYYYKEGMAAPMGNFSTYGTNPKAVQVIDRSIEERTAGVYETIAKMRSPGTYELALFLNTPLVMECFQVEVLPDSIKEKERLSSVLGALSIKHLSMNKKPKVGEEVTLKFQMIDIKTNQPVIGLDDINVMGMMTTQNRHHRSAAKETTTEGIYEANVKFETEGVYYVYVECQSHGLSFNNPQFLVLYASNGENPGN